MSTFTDKIIEGSLTFNFPTNNATKYDAWSFYRETFQDGCARNNKAVDFLFFDSDIAWLIEVKDYSSTNREKSLSLYDEVALKVRDTLAGLMIAKCKAIGDEQSYALEFMKCSKIKVVLHYEFKVSRIHPAPTLICNTTDKLRRSLKAFGQSVYVVNKSANHKTNWSVS